MVNTTTRLSDDALAFLSERHLAMLTTLRADNSPHVVAVGFTFDPKTHIARVITTGGSQKAVNADRSGLAVLSQVDGARWLSLEGRAAVNSDIDAGACRHERGTHRKPVGRQVDRLRFKHRIVRATRGLGLCERHTRRGGAPRGTGLLTVVASRSRHRVADGRHDDGDHEQRRREDDEGDEGSRGRRLACA